MKTDDLYKTVSEQIVKQLEEGNLQPWKCPWSRQGAGFPLRHDGIPYRGVNVLWLWMTATVKGYASPYYMTFQQAKEYGGSVRKGERSAPVLFCQPMTKDATAEDGKEGKESYWIARSYNVFNADQIDGLPEQFKPSITATLDLSERITHAETYFANIGATVEHAGCAAYYQKLADRIVLPPFETFGSPEGYYSTRAHETHHWAGITHRLNRFSFTDGTREDYAREEIVAELAACMTMAQLGFEPVSHADHAAYLDHWIKAIKEDPRYIFQAASKAQQSCDYLNSLQPKE
jgi:antirestriction protein ArdC